MKGLHIITPIKKAMAFSYLNMVVQTSHYYSNKESNGIFLSEYGCPIQVQANSLISVRISPYFLQPAVMGLIHIKLLHSPIKKGIILPSRSEYGYSIPVPSQINDDINPTFLI